MRVIMVTDYAFVNGGAGKVALESALGLAGVVDQVHVFAAVGEPEGFLVGVENLQVTSLGQTKVTELPMREGIIGGLWNKEAAARFGLLLDDFDPSDTVIHLHSWRDALSASPLAVAVARGFRVVMTCHDFGLACPIAGFFDSRSKTICTERGLGLGCLCKSCTGGSFIKKNWFVTRHAIQASRGKLPSGIKHFVFVSKFSEKILASYLPPGAKVHYVDNPISAEPLPRSRPSESKSLIYIGRFSEEKGPDIAAEATYRSGTRIEFVGAGPMEETIRELNPEAELLGWRRPDEVIHILRRARALVFPSIWYETQGMVVNEAAANGIPVIVSDCTAAMDTINRLGHGVAFRSGSVESLVERIKELESDELVEQLSVQGYESFWSAPPTAQSHAKQLIDVYSEVLSV